MLCLLQSCEMVVGRTLFNKPVTYFVKHLETITADLGRILIIDNSPLAYLNNKGAISFKLDSFPPFSSFLALTLISFEYS